MALSKEDHGDVKKAFGKALANKVSKATRDTKAVPYTQEHEDALAAAGLKRYKTKSTGVRNSRKFLD